MCRRCPVLPECRAFALRNSEYDGVWGGMTAGERRAVARGRSEDATGESRRGPEADQRLIRP